MAEKMTDENSIEFGWSLGTKVTARLKNECRLLFSSDYGQWSDAIPSEKFGRAGEPIKLSKDFFEKWFASDRVSLYWAKHDGKVIGYAIAVSIGRGKRRISWVTQLVVAEEFRNRGIATTLLLAIWGFSNHYAWGLVTASPYTIRALEKTTRRRVDPKIILDKVDELLVKGSRYIEYIKKAAARDRNMTEETSQLDTDFYSNHRPIQEMVRQVSKHVPWLLGDLNEGWEWFAFTFQDQKPYDYSAEELADILRFSDAVVRKAYGQMRMNSKKQKWKSFTEREIAFILEHGVVTKSSCVVDIGCGTGRHSLAIAGHCREVIGIDYAKPHIETARRAAYRGKLRNVRFEHADCRFFVGKEECADLVLCLYDVVGTYAETEQNAAILKTITRLLKSGGRALISVMNFDLTLDLAQKAGSVFSFAETPNRLLSLKPGKVMETTGNIFDPNYFLLDPETHLVYRREQFRPNRELPAEYIVRDYRFTKDEIISLCVNAGLDVVSATYVSASDWTNPLSSTDSHSKEILVECVKR